MRRYAQSRHENRLSQRAVHACESVLQDRLGVKKLINCGAQGCVYTTTTKVRVGGRMARGVVKVSAGRYLPEVEQIMWQKLRGWGSHTALPRVKKVYHLNHCAKRAGVSSAYVTVREDLIDVQATPAVRQAVRLLESLEDALFDVPGDYRAAHDVLFDFCHDHERALAKLHRSPLGWRVFAHLAHLQVWLSWHGLTMSDVKVANIGLRTPSLQRGEPYDIVMRDIGCLQLRSSAPKRERQRFKRGPSHVERLGALGP